LGRWRWAALVPMLLLGLSSAWTQNSYARQSYGKNTMVETKSASEDAIYRRLRDQLRVSDADSFIVASDSSFTVNAAAISADGRPLGTPTCRFLVGGLANSANVFLCDEEARRFDELIVGVRATLQMRDFPLHDPADPERCNRFEA